MGDACVVQMWMGTRVIAVVKRLRPRWPGRRDGRSRSMGQGGSRREFVNRPRNPNGAVWAGVRAPEVVSYRGFLIILSWYISYVVYYRYPTTTHPSIVGEEWQFIIVSSYSLDFYFLRAVVWPATYRLRVYNIYIGTYPYNAISAIWLETLTNYLYRRACWKQYNIAIRCTYASLRWR